MAGLWPFSAPSNSAEWLPAGGGLWFGKYGTAMSSGPFENENIRGGGFHTVEIWLESWKPWNRSTILAFYAADHTVAFSLRQAARSLLIENRGRARGGATQKLEIHRIFYGNRSVLIAVTSNGRDTEAYVNGALAAESRTFTFTPDDLTGELVVATSPVTDDSWMGVIHGLAFYDQIFSASEARRSDQSWVSAGHPGTAGGAPPAALYLFNQARGHIIRARAGQGPDLVIPPRYTLVHERFSRPPWEEFELTRHYLKDALINIAGFVPLGFFFCAFFSLVWPRRRSVLITVCCGAAVSITIEVLQSYLPTRDSGTNDVLMNTLGAAIGAGLFRCATLALKRTLRANPNGWLARAVDSEPWAR